MIKVSDLKSVSSLITKGTTPSSIGSGFVSEGVNFVKSESISGSKYLNREVYAFIDYPTNIKLKRSQLQENDLLFSIAGAYLGKLAIVEAIDLPANTNQAVAILRVDKEKANVNYLYYYFSQIHINDYINKLSSQSSQPNLNLDLLGKLQFKNYKLETQKKIAKVLSDLDAKIELNNKINTELEAMAKMLYDYWFVQFDFPDVDEKPYKTSGGKMVWNEELKREIPEGWEVKTVDEYAEVKKGELITAKDSEEGEIKVVAAGISYSYNHSKSNRKKNTITISGSGANAGFINFWREPIFASDCITVRGSTDIETLMLLQHLKFIQAHILSQATGSAQPHVYPSDIKRLNYIIPPVELIENFGIKTISMNDKIAINLKENQQLASLRDWLLPMLMNGQVKVGDVEEELGMVAESGAKYEIQNSGK
jgi:type I restriction enzyme S subunit